MSKFIWMRRNELYNKYKINFDFLYREYVLRKIPVERHHIRDDMTFDHYCKMVRETRQNIQNLIDSHEDDYIASTCLKDYESMLGKNWEQRIERLEKEVCDYYSRFMNTYEEVKKEYEQNKKE